MAIGPSAALSSEDPLVHCLDHCFTCQISSFVFTQDEEEKKPSEGHGRKEQSVLQAKLTNLAIKIGYIGEAGWLAGWLVASV